MQKSLLKFKIAQISFGIFGGISAGWISAEISGHIYVGIFNRFLRTILEQISVEMTQKLILETDEKFVIHSSVYPPKTQTYLKKNLKEYLKKKSEESNWKDCSRVFDIISKEIPFETSEGIPWFFSSFTRF